MAPKEFDSQVLDTMIIKVVEEVFKQMCHVEFTAAPVLTEKDIIEYESRMRVFPMEKFNGPAYVSIVNFYRTQKDLAAGLAMGTFVLFIKEELVERLHKAFGHSSKEADNEDVLLDSVGEFCNILAGNLKNELVGLGYVDLTISAPFNYKNNVPEGVQFDYSLFKKQEIVFTFWNQKCVVVEMCMADFRFKGERRQEGS